MHEVLVTSAEFTKHSHVATLYTEYDFKLSGWAFHIAAL